MRIKYPDLEHRALFAGTNTSVQEAFAAVYRPMRNIAAQARITLINIGNARERDRRIYRT